MSNIKVGDIVTGKVTGIEDYGIFLAIEDNYTGLIHISEISDSFVRNIADYVEMGETINAKVLDIDDKSEKMKLSIKNVNYRSKKGYSSGIVENGSGFQKLGEKLNEWVDNYEL